MSDAGAVNPMHQPIAGPSPVPAIALDMVRRGIWLAPFLILAGIAIWGADGGWSVAYGLALVLLNFALSAALIAFGARVSPAALMASVLFGFLVRLAIIFVAVWLIQDQQWVSMVALGVTIIVAHLGLLVWELRYVSNTLAYPGLKPGVASPLSNKERANQ